MDLLANSLKNVTFPRSLDEFLNSDRNNQLVVGGLAGTSAVLALITLNKLFGTDPIGRSLEILNKFSVQEKKRGIKVDDWINTYNDLHDDDKTGLDKRNTSYQTLVNNYYELATLFYEWGWGQSFHFSYQLPGETFLQATQRHEYYLAGRLGVKPGDRVLDVGCGVGGPLRNITRFTRANITGITLNEYQVFRGNELNRKAQLLRGEVNSLVECSPTEGQVCSARSVQGDFCKLPFEANSFDGIYAIEATCHAPRRQSVYGEIFRTLKPGRIFACYEWCLTPKYDPKNEHHRLIKKKIEEGDGLPDMASQEEVVAALKEVGFELVEARDVALDERFGGDPWWLPLHPSWNPFTFRFQLSPVGKFLTYNMVWLLEMLWLAPPGTYKVQGMLQQGAWGCSNGGVTETFTPMFLMVARKPL